MLVSMRGHFLARCTVVLELLLFDGKKQPPLSFLCPERLTVRASRLVLCDSVVQQSPEGKASSVLRFHQVQAFMERGAKEYLWRSNPIVLAGIHDR